MRTIAAAVNRKFVQPLYYWKNGDKRFARLDELEQSQWQSRDELQALQNECLRTLVEHSYSTTSYYRELLDNAGVTPGDIQSVADLPKIPTLSKSIIQEQMESLVSNAYDRDALVPDSSGGSTGAPTNFAKDIERHRLRRADQIRHDQWCGWRLGEPYALLWGAQRDLSLVRSTREKLIARVVDRSTLFDAFEMRKSDVERLLREMLRFGPTMLIGYANALRLLAKQIKQQGRVPNLPLEGIISSAETLTQAGRAEIEDVFGCHVLNRYGSREVGLIASECSAKQGLHVNFENVIVEILNGDEPAEPGTRGEIVITDLHNFGMPFIRYRMGDVGSMSTEACSCGRGLPLLKSVEGRVSDFLVAADGTKIHGEFFTHLFYGVPGVRQFQLIQETINEARLRLVMNTSPSAENLEPVLTEINKVLGERTKIEVDYCDEIPVTASGKFLFTISKISG